ncbi:MAG: N-acetylmuramoyl-L-alanine amidase [Pseudomonadales bacterium]|nr:N-acetylmuramoyl-L-alanine amidase [Pseudomonadales bacterium]
MKSTSLNDPLCYVFQSIRKYRVGQCFALLLLSACSSGSMVYVESTNQNSRIDYIVIHATAENFAESLRLLSTRTESPVSSHYLIPEVGDPSYPRRSLRVYSLVPEHRRAWHAGVSYWAEETNLNDRSIGIEVVNEFECTGTDKPVPEIELAEVECQFVPFSDEQIELLADLLHSIQERYPGINPIDIVAHSDIAIMRKSDPGPLFPWKQLYEQGIGVWPDQTLAAKYSAQFSAGAPAIDTVQAALLALGYQIEVTSELDKQTQFAMRAFQLHFRPSDYSGKIDAESLALLWALLEEHRPAELRELRRTYSF